METQLRWLAYSGILAVAVTLVNDVSLLIAPPIASSLLPVNGLLWLIWWILTGLTLFRPGRKS